MLIRKHSIRILAAVSLAAIPVPLAAAHQRPDAHHAAGAAGDGAATQATTTTTTSAQTTTTATSSTTTSASTTTSTTTTAAPAPAPTAAKPAPPAQATATSQDQAITVQHAAKLAHAAGDPGVTIVDFSFSPGTITIHVGDTVTWTNNGQQPHTATANDSSFNTGTLNHGQSGSHTFTKTGTFAYICAIHPNMHGTVVVQAATSTPSSGSGSSGSSGTSSSTGSTSSATTPTATTAATSTSTAPTLPVTGLSLGSVLVAAAALLGGGLFLRRRARM
jgi:plastocyanin